MLQASKLTEGVQSLECAIAISIDDLLNGNITADHTHFFTGGIFINQYLSYLGGNISAIASNLSVATQNSLVAVLNSASDAQSGL